MKRIIDGVTYNTDTATQIAKSVCKDETGDEVTSILYQTRGGAFFVRTNVHKRVWIQRLQENEIREHDDFEPLSAQDAHKWIMTGNVEVFDNPFEEPPEAAAESEPGATIYIRVPATLKKRVDEAASQANVSGNVWAMRCLERCLAAQAPEPVPPKPPREKGIEALHKLARRKVTQS